MKLLIALHGEKIPHKSFKFPDEQWSIQVREGRKDELIQEINKLINNFRKPEQII